MSSNVSGIILAGGQGSRMHHVNKGLQIFAGIPLIQHVINRLKDQVDDIVISANTDVSSYEQFGYKVVTDVSTSRGPLSGIQSAASHVRHEHIFVTACDTPYLPTNIISELNSSEADVTVAESNKGIEPLICLVTRQATLTIQNRLDADRYSVMGWLKSCDANIKDLKHLGNKPFANINTLDELKNS